MTYSLAGKILLPVSYPWITTYPIFENPLSIIQLHPESHNWIMSSFLQLVCYGEEALSFYDFNYRTCPYLTVQRIHKDLLLKSDISLIEFLKKMINENQYIYLIVNPKYIPAYQLDHDGRHDLFIYGFDDSKQLFHIADHFNFSKYGLSVCTYQELYTSITHLNPDYEGYLGFNHCIEFLSYNDDPIYNHYYSEINLARIKDSLLAFLESKPIHMWSIQDYRVARYGEKEYTFGINCYNFLHHALEQIRLQKSYSLQSFYLISDHSHHLLRSIQYLHNNHLIKHGEQHISQLDKIYRLALSANSLIIKYMLSKNISLIDRLHKIYDQIELLQRQEVNDIISDL